MRLLIVFSLSLSHILSVSLSHVMIVPFEYIGHWLDELQISELRLSIFMMMRRHTCIAYFVENSHCCCKSKRFVFDFVGRLISGGDSDYCMAACYFVRSHSADSCKYGSAMVQCGQAVEFLFICMFSIWCDWYVHSISIVIRGYIYDKRRQCIGYWCNKNSASLSDSHHNKNVCSIYIVYTDCTREEKNENYFAFFFSEEYSYNDNSIAHTYACAIKYDSVWIAANIQRPYWIV